MRALIVLLVLAAFSFGQTSTQAASPRPKNGTTRRTTDTEQQLRFRLEFSPHDHTAHQKLQKLLWKKFSWRALLAEDADWIKNNPANCSVEMTELVSIAETNGDPEFAITQLRLHLENVKRGDDTDEYDNEVDRLAALLVRRGRPAESLPLFDELLRLYPNEGGYWADRSAASEALGQLDDAIKCLRKSVELGPSMDYAHQLLAAVLFKNGDLRGSETEYRAAISVYNTEYKSGDPVDSYHALMKNLIAIQAKDRSESSLAAIHLKLAQVLLAEKNYDAAVAETESAIQADKDHLSAFYLRAEIYEAKGDLALAALERQNVESIMKKMAAGAKNLDAKEMGDLRALYLASDDDSTDIGLPIEIVKILEPNLAKLVPMERMSLAGAYFELGRISDATAQWNKAIATEPKLDNARNQSHVGQLLMKANVPADALPHLQRAYELEPENTTYRMDYEEVRETSPHS